MNKRLKRLYEQIPQVEGCDPSCGGCCGPSPLSVSEAVRLGIEGGLLITPLKSTLTHGVSCEYYEPMQGCSRYDERPLLCRLFGASEDPGLVCPKGARASSPLTVSQTNQIMRAYRKVG
ncbi:YkgJ family cysteine cluster protein [Vibrio owensii]|uniref:YkgJ family cysteine cluster protein n=1 Tax=Vibrio owensii TaxID=696485 RepID=UPI0018F24B0E